MIDHLESIMDGNDEKGGEGGIFGIDEGVSPEQGLAKIEKSGPKCYVGFKPAQGKPIEIINTDQEGDEVEEMPEGVYVRPGNAAQC